MPKFDFTGEVPMIFADLSYGPGVTVEHEHPAFAPLPVQVGEFKADSDGAVSVSISNEGDGPLVLYPLEPEGATVTLYPGDTLTIDRDYPEHAYLQPVGGEIVLGKKLTIAEIRDALTARGVEFPADAKKAALEKLLASQPDIPTIEDGETVEGTALDVNTSGDPADTSSTSSTDSEE